MIFARIYDSILISSILYLGGLSYGRILLRLLELDDGNKTGRKKVCSYPATGIL